MKILKCINEELKLMEKQLGAIQKHKKALEANGTQSGTAQLIALEHDEIKIKTEKENLIGAQKIIQKIAYSEEIIEGPRFLIT